MLLRSQLLLPAALLLLLLLLLSSPPPCAGGGGGGALAPPTTITSTSTTTTSSSSPIVIANDGDNGSDSGDAARTELVHSFVYVDFWDLPDEYHAQYIAERWYRSVAISGIRLSRQRNSSSSSSGGGGSGSEMMFVSVPRWGEAAHLHVPATLNRVVTRQVDTVDGGPGIVNETRLQPFPSFEWNDIRRGVHGDPWGAGAGAVSATERLFSVVGFEIDAYNRMWILDQGRVGGRNAVPGGIKLLVWDLTSDRLLDVHTFLAPHEVSLTHSFLKGIAVDANDDIAYISDSGIPSEESGSADMRPALLLWDRQSRVVKRVLEGVPSTSADDSVWLHVNGEPCLRDTPLRSGIDGIALSCDLERLYWSPLTSRRLYAIQTDYLRMYGPEDEQRLAGSVLDLGDKREASSGLACTSHGSLLLTGVESSTIYTVPEQKELAAVVAQHDVAAPSSVNVSNLMTVVTQDTEQMVWPDSIGFNWNSSDGGPWMYFVSNNMCDFLQRKEWNTSRPNFYIWRSKIGQYSYIAGCKYATRSFGWMEWALVSSGVAVFLASIVCVVIVTKLLDHYSLRKQRARRLAHYHRLEDEHAS